MHQPTGLTPNLKIKTALTPVGVDAGVRAVFLFFFSNSQVFVAGVPQQ